VPQPGERGRRYPMEAGLVARVVERRQSIRTDDYVETCRREGVEPVDGGLPFPYWLGVPMIAGDEVVGVIALRTDTQPYREEDERLLMNIAGLAGLAFRSAGLYEERARAYGELAAAQDQLVQAEKLRALGEMASGVAHDFNNLLTSIIGRAQILLRTISDPRLRQSITAIEQAALDGAQTVRRIQEFTRQRRDQPFVAVDVNGVVEAALEITQSRWRDEAQGRGIDIRVVTDLGAVPPIAGDPVDLRGALTNLILNAVDAMPTGGVLTVSTRADAGRVTVTIADTGDGMTEEAKRRLFEPFFTTKGPKGTGLGLSMTFGIVSRHGGHIDVESAPGRGATFRLSFPGAAVEMPAETARMSATNRQSEPAAHCLVVDDEEGVRETLGDLLSLAGHTTVLAGSGEEAIQLLKAEAFDLVFTDLAMPGLSGWQVARACKEVRPDAPVLLVTGLGVELSRQEMAAHGVDAVLSKPLKIDEVLDAVAQHRRR
jgi:signal transduction histidine kinase/CheY-like chemotaxis protein